MNNDYLQNWTKFLKNKNPEDFLKIETMWGQGQGQDNQGRCCFAKFVEDYINITKTPIKILEVGFGTNITYQLLKDKKIIPSQFVTYYGTDVTPQFMELATKQHPEIILSEMFEGGVSYPSQYFDITYIRHVLEHQNGYKQLLTELFRVTRYYTFINMFIPLNKESNEDILKFDSKFFHNVYSYSKFTNFCHINQFALTYDKTFISDEVVEVRKDKFEPFKDEIIILQRIDE
jgi:ubiquinone/menaquinone biosynthesis C-methylase UbiE